jgi:inorganic pyrophosphatase
MDALYYCQLSFEIEEACFWRITPMNFWQRLDLMLAEHPVVIDRPQGARHPRFPEIIYPLAYGYLKDTSGGDGNEVDVWKGSLSGNKLVGVICTVDSFKNDAELKLLIDCSVEEIDIINKFYNQNEVMSGLVIMRSE